MNRGLRLDMSLSHDAFESSMDATYRKEGLSVGPDHMRLYGETVRMDVAFSDLTMGERIGSGACSTVNLARHKKTNETFAVKMFNVSDRAQESQLYNEVLLLTSFQCDCLISLKGAFHHQGRIGVIIEYMDKGSLEFLCHSDVTLSERVMAAISFQIIWGLGYLHYEKQIHRDVKPANILMNSKGQVKLSDFGISKELDNSTAMSNTAIGSYRYMSPERLLGDKYDSSGDVWSVAITIIELWTKSYPFSTSASSPVELYTETEHINFDRLLPKTRFSPLMRQFLRAMLSFVPSERATCNELAGSQWFETVGVNSLLDAQEIIANWIVERKKGKFSAPVGRPGAIPRDRDIHQMSISLDNSKSYGSSAPMSIDNSRGVAFGGGKNSHGNRMTSCEENYDDDVFEEAEDSYDGRGSGGHHHHHNQQQQHQHPSKMSRGGYGSKYDDPYSRIEETKTTHKSKK